MKKILIVFISLFVFFSCANEATTDETNETNETEEVTSKDVNLEEDLGELESELEETEQDTIKEEE